MTRFERALTVFDEFVHRYGRLPTEVDPDYLEMLRMSKYRVLPVPDVQPGKCANCGSSKQDGRQYIDFSLHIDWYGAVILCTLCLKDIAEAAGLFEQLNKEIDVLKESTVALNTIHQQGERLHQGVLHIFEEVKAYFDAVHSVGDNSSSDSSPGMGTDEAKSDKSGVVAAKPRVTKSTSGAGSKDVPSLAELLGNDKSK